MKNANIYIKSIERKNDSPTTFPRSPPKINYNFYLRGNER
nr:MAG TPA: hypothetical protein [Caudoviricetes sp.]